MPLVICDDIDFTLLLAHNPVSMKKTIYPLIWLAMTLVFVACAGNKDDKTAINPVTEQEVVEAQQTWGDGIVKIGKVFSEGGDYRKASAEHIDALYDYQTGPVLFKPTMAAEQPFRTTRQGALSYFAAGDPEFPEDHGFAIKPWIAVRFENAGIKVNGDMALAMGHYYFTPADGSEEVKVEFSFVYQRDAEGKLRIILHDSHLPFSPDSHQP